MKEIAIGIFAAYIITAVLVDGEVFYSPREWMKKKTPWLVKGKERRHMFDCRMCVGAWVSLGVWVVLFITSAFSLQPSAYFIIYGVEHFLVMQER
jgi:uncharacterized iron-regulated membrane protein